MGVPVTQRNIAPVRNHAQSFHKNNAEAPQNHRDCVEFWSDKHAANYSGANTQDESTDRTTVSSQPA